MRSSCCTIRGLAEEAAANHFFSLHVVSEALGQLCGYQSLLGFTLNRSKLTGQRFPRAKAQGRRFVIVVFTPFISTVALSASENKIPIFGGWRDGSVDKNSYCPCKESRVSSQHPYGISQLPVVAALRDLTSSFDPCGLLQAHTCI